MSTILKALRRLEEDRNPLVERPLREQVASAQADPAVTAGADSQRGGRGRIALVFGLAIAVAAGAGVLAYLSVGNEPPAVAANTVAERPSPRREARPRPTPSRRELAARKAEPAQRASHPGAVASGLPAEALASEVKVIDRPMPAPRLSDPDAPGAAAPTAPGRVARSQPYTEPVAPGVAAATPSRAPRSARLSAVAEPMPSSGATADAMQVAAVPEATPAPIRGPAKAPPAEPKPAKTAEPKVIAAVPEVKPAQPKAPAPEAKPAEAKAKPVEPKAEPAEPKASPPEPKPAPILQALAPNVRVEQTRWHPDPTRRTAVLDVDGGAHEVEEGDSLGALVVTKIEPSAVVFTKDGVELRRRIGE